MLAIATALLQSQSTCAEVVRSPTPKELHNALEMPSALSKKFDPHRWKIYKAERWTMLFDLTKAGLFGKSKIEGRTLLGEPDVLPKQLWRSQSSDLYALGDCDNESVFLEVSYQGGSKGLFCLRLRYVPNGRLSSSTFGWVTQNVSGDEAASRINENYCLVGMPVDNICQVMGHPRHLKGTEYRVCHVVQFKYTADKRKVEKFRIFYRVPGNTKLVPSRWQDQDLRTDPRCFTDAISVMNANVTGIDAELLRPGGMFSSEIWKSEKTSRAPMLFDLCVTNRLIGMERSKVHKLLGQPDLDPSNCQSCPSARPGAPDTDSIIHNSEWYLLRTPKHCGVPPSTYFQVLYENNCVKRYRLDSRGGYSGRMINRFGAIKPSPKDTKHSVAPEEEIDKFEPKLYLPISTKYNYSNIPYPHTGE